MRYDAFISYRHGALDGRVAEKLQRILESYRVPRALARQLGRKSLRRVFRDREELPTSANLSETIDEALRESEYLIVVCSRRTCESIWVMREVDRFIELRGRERVIALLIDGEPEEAIPGQLRSAIVEGKAVEVEPLAADIRAATPAKSLRLLRAEALRIIAPILGCGFDDLRQRHRLRRIWRNATLASIAAAIVLAFGIMSFAQYLRIQEQMQLKLKSQSYVLSEYSKSAYQDGDPVTAALLAIQALPEDAENPERPYVAEADAALIQALDLYNYSGDYQPWKHSKAPGFYSAFSQNAAGSHIALHASASELWLLTLSDPDNPLRLSKAPYYWDAVVFAEGNSFVYPAPEGITAIDMDSGDILWQKALQVEKLACSGDGKRIAALVYDEEYTPSLRIFRAEDGAELGSTEIDDGNMMGYFGSDNYAVPMALNEDGSRLIVHYPNTLLCLYDTLTWEETALPPQNSFNASIAFCGDYAALVYADALWQENEEDSMYSQFVMQDNMLMLLDMRSGAVLLQRNLGSAGQPRVEILAEGRFVYANGEEIFALDPKTLKEESLCAFSSDIRAFDIWNGHIIAGLEGNRHALYSPEREAPVYYEDTLVCAQTSIGEEYALAAMENGLIKIARREEKPLLFHDLGETALFAIIQPGEGRIACLSESFAYLLDATDGAVIQKWEVADSEEATMAFYGEHCLAVQDLGSVSLYDSASGELLRFIEAGALHADGIAAYGQDDSLTWIDGDTLEDTEIPGLPETATLFEQEGPYFHFTESYADSYILHAESGEIRLIEEYLHTSAVIDGDFIAFDYVQDDLHRYSFREDAWELFLSAAAGQDIWPEAHIVPNTRYVRVTCGLDTALYDISAGEKLLDISRPNAQVTDVAPHPYEEAIVYVRYSEDESDYTIFYDIEQAAALFRIDGFLRALDEGGALTQREGGIARIALYTREDVRTIAEETLSGLALTEEQLTRYHIFD